MKLDDIVAGSVTFAANTFGNLLYGFCNAREVHLPYQAYMYTAVGLGIIYTGKDGMQLPGHNFASQIQLTATLGLATAVSGAAFYGLGYGIGRLTK